MGAFLQILGYLLSAATISFAAIYNSVDSLPAIPYDFVIIGGKIYDASEHIIMILTGL